MGSRKSRGTGADGARVLSRRAQPVQSGARYSPLPGAGGLALPLLRDRPRGRDGGLPAVRNGQPDRAARCGKGQVQTLRSIDVPVAPKKRTAKSLRYRLLSPGVRCGIGGRALVFLLEAVHTAFGVHQLLPAREEGVAVRADFHSDIAFVSRARFERVPAGADHVYIFIGGMNSSFHDSTQV